MNYAAGKLYVFIEKALAEGKNADEDGYYVFTKNELIDGAGVAPSTLSKNMAEVVDMLPKENKGWMPGSADAIDLFSDMSFSRGVLKFRRNPAAMDPALDYYWAKQPLYPYFTYTCYDDKHRRRINGDEAKYGYFPHSWSEEQVEAAYSEWINRPKEKGTYSYIESDVKSPEQQRIAAIKANGGRHLQNFKKENITYEMCLVAVQLDGEALYYVPDEFRKKEIYEAAVKNSGSMLGEVPEKIITKKMCENAVANNGLALEFVPDKYKTLDVCLIAASQNPLAMQKMPEEFITVDFVAKVVKRYCHGVEAVSSLPKSFKNAKFYLPLVEVCPEVIWKLPKAAHTAAISKACLNAMKCRSLAEAVTENPEFLSQIHPSLYDYEACKAFVTSEFFTKGVDKKDHIGPYSGFNSDSDREKGLFYMNRNYDAPYSIPHMAKWPDICMLLVSSNPGFLVFVKPELLTEEMCMKAVENSEYGYVIENIPVEFRTEEICLSALRKDPHNIKHIPEEYLNDELCLDAVKRSGYILGDIPEQYMTYDVCLTAMAHEYPEIEKVPETLLDKRICLVALEHGEYSFLLEKIPERLRDYDVYFSAVKQNGAQFDEVPDEYLTYELCFAAVKAGIHTAERIPADFFTEELCLELLKSSDYNFKFIPKDKLTEKICLQGLQYAATYTGSVISEIPEEMITQEMVNLALEKSVWSFKGIPERFVTEEMIMNVARRAKGRAADNIPTRLRTRAFLDRLKNEFGMGWDLEYYKIEPND